MSSPCRILYVDDNQDSRDMASLLLDYSGIDCAFISAESASEALALIEAEPFDLYIFDYVMPEISGIELCRYIRQFDRDTPVMFFSARPMNIDEAKAVGANEYLIKPNDLDKFPSTVKQLLDRSGLCA